MLVWTDTQLKSVEIESELQDGVDLLLFFFFFSSTDTNVSEGT